MIIFKRDISYHFYKLRNPKETFSNANDIKDIMTRLLERYCQTINRFLSTLTS